MAVEWTAEQRQVIELRNKNILVSAAAGSGKTAVLVERIIERITDREHPVDIDRLLVVTFTKAAAAEMRQRISDAIEKKREEEPEDLNLMRQASLIHNAQITTIDSFCLFVVRNHFGEIDLDPDFRIADEGELRLLEQDVLNEVFEAEYQAKPNDIFLYLIDAYSGKRNDQSVKDMVSRIYRMSESSPWQEEWIAGIADSYKAENVEKLLALPVVLEMEEFVKRLLADYKSRLLSAVKLALAPDGPNAYAAALEADIALLSGAEELSDFRGLFEFFQSLSFVKLPALRKFEGDMAKKNAVQETRNQFKKDMEDIRKKYFMLSPEEMLSQIAAIRPVAQELCRLALLYKKALAEKKKKRRIADFSDIEHFALRILVDEKTKEARPAAEGFRKHFEEIMIDEYQDSNQVQEEILCAISREREGIYNRFMVGDVKQSIYRFRLARPELFMEKFDAYGRGQEFCRRIDLHKNFRSRGEVVDFTNDIFDKIMKADLGEVEYDSKAALYCGAAYPENFDMGAEVLLLDTEEEPEDFSREDRRKLEARMAAERILRLMDETRVTDRETGELRPMKYSDIVILFRSLKGWGTDFAAVLSEYGIPSHVESSTGYFSAIEVQTVLNMLRILDNPLLDIPMASVLKSHMAGLSDEELAEIRVSDRSVPFAAAALSCMKRAAEETEGLELVSAEKLKNFYEKYQRLRRAKDLPIHELITRILSETGYGNYVAALPAGAKRAANLDMLREKAIAYEKSSYKGLFHFVRYIDQLEKYEIDFGEADATGENADAVHIMTIHKSKGLEFPVVFVSGISKSFNRMDEREKMVIHPDLGLGIFQMKLDPKIKRPCFIRTEIAEHIRRENLGEELRVLYVALTRAKEKLILTGTVRDQEKTIAGYMGNVIPGRPLPFADRVKASCYADWIIPAALSYPQKYELTMVTLEELVADETARRLGGMMDYDLLCERIGQADPAEVELIRSAFSYEYPYKSDMDRKSKYSVSELKHNSMLQRYDRAEGEAELPEFLAEEKEPYVPDFALDSKDKLREDTASQYGVSRGALRGTAVHRVMECLDFVRMAELDRKDQEGVAAFVKEELFRMENSGEVTKEMKELVPPAMIEAFVKSGVAGRMADAALKGNLFKEKPFVMEQDGILIQGIIDVFWVEEDGIVVLDYKTDRVKAAEELVLRYQTQLKLYGDALKRIFVPTRSFEVKERYIYSFRLKEVVAL